MGRTAASICPLRGVVSAVAQHVVLRFIKQPARLDFDQNINLLVVRAMRHAGGMLFC
jgi:hypothetical protein